MSWLFSRALVEEYSLGTCSGGAQSALSKLTPTPQAYCLYGKMKKYYRPFLFGMTFAPLTEEHGEAVLTSFLEDSPAKISVLPAEEQGLKESGVDCGVRWRGLLVRYDRDLFSSKTVLCSEQEDSQRFSKTLPKWGMMRSGECSERETLEPLINATGCGYWRTSTVNDAKNSTLPPSQIKRSSLVGQLMSQWPTPTVHGNYNRKGASATSGDGLATAVRMWPTPLSQDSRHALRDRGKYKLGEMIAGQTGGGRLNPMWVEWLMGWPLGWTDYAPLGMDKFQQWQLSLSANYTEEYLKKNTQTHEDVQ